jgi:hypothetical protein
MSRSGFQRLSKMPTTICGLSRLVTEESTFSLTSSTSPPEATVFAAICSTSGLALAALA